jgi:uncharacterized membrane protein YagU involved in acid resistance
MAMFPPERRSSRELVFVFAIAIIVGAVVGIGLTVLLMPRAKACKDCVPKECSGRPAQLDGQRICPQLAEFTKSPSVKFGLNEAAGAAVKERSQ